MTIQKLKACRYIALEIDTLQERITRLRSAMERTTPSMGDGTGIHAAPDPDKLALQLGRLQELEMQLRNRVMFLEDEIEQVEAWFATLNPSEAALLRARYVSGMSWRQAERVAGYSDASNGRTGWRIQCRIMQNGRTMP